MLLVCPSTVARMRIFTVGHSNLEFEKFVQMLEAAGVQSIIDVRKLTGSKKYPWFNDDSLAEHLPKRGIAYGKSPGLAGRRNVSVSYTHLTLPTNREV